MKNNLKIMIIALMVLSLFPMILAEDCKDHRQTTNYNLTITSNNATQCNLSAIQYPIGSQKIFNIELTKDGTTFYSMVENSNFTEIGKNYLKISCTDGSLFLTGEECVNVTPSGFDGTLGFYFLVFILSAGVIVLGYRFEDAWVVILGSFALILFGLFILFYGIDGIKDTIYTWGIGIITLMLGAYFMLISALEKLQEGL